MMSIDIYLTIFTNILIHIRIETNILILLIKINSIRSKNIIIEFNLLPHFTQF